MPVEFARISGLEILLNQSKSLEVLTQPLSLRREGFYLIIALENLVTGGMFTLKVHEIYHLQELEQGFSSAALAIFLYCFSSSSISHSAIDSSLFDYMKGSRSP